MGKQLSFWDEPSSAQQPDETTTAIVAEPAAPPATPVIKAHQGPAPLDAEPAPDTIPDTISDDQMLIPGFASLVLAPKPATNGDRRLLADVFTVPPFTVLDARQGYWQERKRAWLSLGLRGEVGRGDVMPSGAASVYSGASEWSGYRGAADNNPDPSRLAKRDLLDRSPQTSDLKHNDRKRKGLARTFGQDLMRGEHVVGENLTWAKGKREALDGTSARILASGPKIRMAYHPPPDGADYAYPTEMLAQYSGTSIFDPVLCELAYRWFCPPGGAILDPFAGGPTRGVVAAYLGHSYTGIDVRPEQVAANRMNWDEVTGTLALTDVELASTMPPPSWIHGDSIELDTLLSDETLYDLVFSCPPYYDLEVYSEMAEDGSCQQTYAEFLTWLGLILGQGISRLRPNRFLVLVVGEIRDKKTGAYRNFVGDTTALCKSLGLAYYNEAVLITSVGSLPLRVGKQFGRWRKLGKGHQNVLIYFSGDLKAIADEFPMLGQYVKEES